MGVGCGRSAFAVVSHLYPFIRSRWVFGLSVPLSRWFRTFLPRPSFALGIGFDRPAFAVVSRIILMWPRLRCYFEVNPSGRIDLSLGWTAILP